MRDKIFLLNLCEAGSRAIHCATQSHQGDTLCNNVVDPPPLTPLPTLSLSLSSHLCLWIHLLRRSRRFLLISSFVETPDVLTNRICDGDPNRRLIVVPANRLGLNFIFTTALCTFSSSKSKGLLRFECFRLPSDDFPNPTCFQVNRLRRSNPWTDQSYVCHKFVLSDLSTSMFVGWSIKVINFMVIFRPMNLVLILFILFRTYVDEKWFTHKCLSAVCLKKCVYSDTLK